MVFLSSHAGAVGQSEPSLAGFSLEQLADIVSEAGASSYTGWRRQAGFRADWDGCAHGVTVSGGDLQLGSIINFRIVEQRVRFDVSLDVVDKRNIQLGSRLLTVANHVSKGAP